MNYLLASAPPQLFPHPSLQRRHHRWKMLAGASIASCLAILPGAAKAADGVWVTGTGLWSDPLSWSNGIVADGANSTADFSTLDLFADGLVHLDTARTIGNLTFGDLSIATPASWVVDNNGSATNSLTLAASTGTPTVTVGALAPGSKVTLQVDLKGTNGLTKSGVGTLLLAGTNTYTGSTTVSGGVLAFAAPTAIAGSGANVMVQAGAAAAANYAIDQAFLGRIATASTGVVALGADSANALDLSTAGANLAAASLGAIGNFSYTGTLTPNAGVYRLGGGGGALLLPGVNALTGANGLVVSSGGMAGSAVVLTSDNNYTGGTTVNGGVLTFSALTNLGTSGISFGGGTLQWASGNTADISAQTITIGPGGATLDVGANNVTLSSPIGNNGTGSLTKAGTGVLTLNGTNTYSGGTFLNAGVLLVSADGALGAAAGGVTFTGNSTLRFGAVLPLAATRTLTSNPGITATLDVQTNTITLANPLSGSGAFAKANTTGTLIYTGTGAFSGALTIGGGIFRVDPGATLTTGAVSPAAVAGAQFAVQGGNYTSTANSTINATGAGFLLSSGSAAFNGGIQTANNDGAVIRITGGNFSASNVSVQRDNNNVAGTFASGFILTGGTANVGTIGIGTNNSFGHMSVEGTASLTATGTVTIGNQVTSGRGGAMRVIGGTFTATDPVNGVVLAKTNGANANNVAAATFSGGVSKVEKFTLGFDATVTAGSATITLTNNAALSTGTLYIGSGGIVKNGTSGLTTTVNLTAGLLGALADWQSAMGVTIGGTAANPLTIKAASDLDVPHDIVLNGAVGGSGGFTKTGGGTLTVAANSSYTGGAVGTTISAGTLQVGSGGATGSLGTSVITNNANLAFNRSDTALVFANNVSGNGTLTQNGTGTVTLTGTNTFTGNTTINAGMLRLNSSLPSPLVTVNNTGTLGGPGPVGGTATVNNGGHVAPSDATGSAPGTLTLGGLTLASSSIVDFDFSSLSTFDKVIVSNPDGLTINGTGLNLFASNTTDHWTVPGAYNLFQYSGTLGGVAGTNLNSALTVLNPEPGLTYSFGSSGGFITLNIGTLGVIPAWNVTTGGSWVTPGNWTATVPNAVGATANFGSKITTPSTVTLDGNKTVGTLQFSNANSYTIAQGTSGTLFLSKSTGNATIDATSGSHAISAPVSLTSNTVATVFDAADTLTISGVVAGSGSLTKAGLGTLTLTKANTYSGGTSLNAGTVLIRDSQALSSAPVQVNSNSTLQAGADNLVVTNPVTVSPSTTTMNMDTVANTLTLSGAINGDGGIAKAGTGRLILGVNNGYIGSTTVTGGTLTIPLITDGNLISPIGSSTNAAANLVLNGGTLEYNGADTTTDRLFSVGTTGGTINSVGAGAVNFTNTGTVGFLGSNTARTLTLGGLSIGANTINAVIGNNGTGATGLVKTGLGRWVLNGTNTFTGQTIISGGTLALTNAAALGGSTLNYDNQGGALDTTGIFSLTLGGLMGAQNLVLPGALTVGGNGQDTTYSGALSNGGTITKSGTGKLTLTGTNDFSSGTTISAGTLVIGGGTFTTSTITPTASAALFQQTGGTVTGTLLNLENGNSLQLKATFDGGTATFSQTKVGATNATSAPCVLTINGGTIGLGDYSSARDGGPNFNTTAGLIIKNGTVTANSVQVSTANSWSNMTMTGGSLEIGNAASLGSFFLGGGTNNARGGNLTMSGGTLTYLGTDGLVLNQSTGSSIGQATFSGGTANLTGITLNAATATGGSATLNLNGTSTVYLGTVGLQANTSVATANVTMNGGIFGALATWSAQPNITLGAAGATFQASDAANGAHDISLLGVFSGSGALTKTGAGKLTLGGADNPYTGATTVNAGTLLLSGSISGTAAVAVNSGDLQLGRSNAINDAALVTLTSAVLETQGFGESVGALTLGQTSTIDLGSGASVLRFANSQASVWNGTLSIANWSGSQAGGGTDELFFGVDATGLASSQVAQVRFLNPAGFSPGVYGGKMLATGELVAVPEPGALLGLLGGVGMLIGKRRRRG